MTVPPDASSLNGRTLFLRPADGKRVKFILHRYFPHPSFPHHAAARHAVHACTDGNTRRANRAKPPLRTHGTHRDPLRSSNPAPGNWCRRGKGTHARRILRSGMHIRPLHLHTNGKPPPLPAPTIHPASAAAEAVLPRIAAPANGELPPLRGHTRAGKKGGTSPIHPFLCPPSGCPCGRNTRRPPECRGTARLPAAHEWE